MVRVGLANQLIIILCKRYVLFAIEYSRSVVSSEADKHDARLADLALGLELHLRGGRLHGVALDDGGLVAASGLK